MKKCGALLCSLLALLTVVGAPGCGSSNRQLESLTIVDRAGSSVELIVNASGTFNMSPTTEMNVPVGWYLFGPGLDPPPAAYALTSQNFVLPCGGYTTIAVAPMDPKAPNTGPIPQQVFQDLVITRTKSSEGGFVAVSMLGQTSC
jgi:hypothetical protein